MADDLRRTSTLQETTLEIFPDGINIEATVPTKRIHDGDDLSFFLRTRAYADIMTFVLQLNRSMVPERNGPEEDGTVQTWPTDSPAIELSPYTVKIASLIQSLKMLMESAPPETGPRRFGNAAFRTWFSSAERAVPSLLRESLSSTVWDHAKGESERVTLEQELAAYLLGSFGSAERLDYGTGHELSFLAFLGCVWKLGGFARAGPGVEERGIVVGVIQPYLELVRSLILTYTLEPAGSHGVWGLDDHSFLPYILGSAQYCPPVLQASTLPTVGSLKGAPAPGNIAKKNSVDQYRSSNIYFSAIGFIFDVKTGPFWEHSPTLFDISGIKDGWAKINKGMVKMYNAEVLSKFPVVQHFPFGSLFRWEEHPLAVTATPSPHINAQPSQKQSLSTTSMRANEVSGGSSQIQAGTAAPWARPAPQTGLMQARLGTLPNRTPLGTTTAKMGRQEPANPPPRFPPP